MGTARARLPGTATIVSVLAHAGVLWAAVSSLPPPPATYQDPVVVVSFAAVRGDASATAEDRPQAMPDAATPAKQPPAIQPPPVALPAAVTPPKPAAPSSPSQTAAVSPSPAPFVHPPIQRASASSSAAASAPSQTAATPPSRAEPPPQRKGTRDGLDVDAPNGDGVDYSSRLRSWLEGHKTYPKRAKMMRLTGVVTVRFAVDRRGHLLTGDIVRGSGHPDLDQEVLAMLSRSDPFPAPPRGVPGPRIEITTPIEFSLKR